MSHRPSVIEIPETSLRQIPSPRVKGIKTLPPRPRFDEDVSDGGGEGFVAFLLLAAFAGIGLVFFF